MHTLQPTPRSRCAVLALAAAAALGTAPAHAWDDFDDLFDFGRGKTGILWIGGDYKFTDGNYSSETAVLGDEVWWQQGTVWQTGGSWALSTKLQLGSSSGWIGTYTLDGGLLGTATTGVAISNGWATFTQNGGSHMISGELGLGGTSCCRGASHGTYNMAGGVLFGGNLRIGASSDWMQTAGMALFFNGGVVMPNGSLVLQAGHLQLGSGSVIEVQRSGGTTLRGRMSITGGVLVGTLGISGELTAGGGDHRGLLDNRLYGQTTINGIFSPDGGISNRGTLTLTNTSRVALEGAGLTNHVGGVLLQASLMEGNAGWHNLGQATLSGEFTGSGDMASSGSVLVERSLLLTRSGNFTSSGDWITRSTVITLGSGTHLVNSGTMLFDNAHLAGNGSFTNDTAGRFTARGNGSLVGKLQNRGVFTLEAGSFALGAGLGNDGALVMGSAASLLSGGLITNKGSVSGLGRIDNPITQRGLLRAEGGTLALQGALTLQGGSRLEVAAASTLHAVAGDLRMVGSTVLEAGSSAQAPATLRVAGTLNQDGTLSGSGHVAAAHIRNAGTLRWGNGSTVVSGTLDVRHTGRVELTDQAEVRFEDAVTLRGSSLLSIAASASASFESGLTLEPGARLAGNGLLLVKSALDLGSSAMTLAYDGLIVFGSDSRYRAQIGTAGHDRLGAAAGIGFDGTLAIELLPGFAARVGDRFQLFDASQFGGTFAQFDTGAAVLPYGLEWDFSALASQGVLGVAPIALPDPSPVPEPESVALLLGGLLAVGLRGRFRRHAAA